MSVIEITNNNFEHEILNSDRPVLIDFWASWCMPCKMLSPTVDKISEEQNGVKVCKINIDDNPELAQKFNVMSIPTLVFMKNGNELSRSVGIKSKSSILKMIS